MNSAAPAPGEMLSETPDGEQIQQLLQFLTAAGTLTLPQPINGLFAAAAASGDDFAASGYSNAWVRDNVHIAHAQLVAGNLQYAITIQQRLSEFFHRHRQRFLNVIAEPARAADPMQRPHIRFNPVTLDELPETWAHAQNDALGAFLWISCLLVRAGHTPITPRIREVILLLLQYWEAIDIWEDEDSGHWEEQRKVAASSVGCVLAGLSQLQQLLQNSSLAAALNFRPPDLQRLHTLQQNCHASLLQILPWECRQSDPTKQRRYDAALLFLIYPLNIIQDRSHEDQIIADVCEHLQGPHGIRRYPGDSYWCADYRQLLSADQRTADFSDDLSVRNQLLQPGGEAQWCLFDPVLSCIHGRRYRESGAAADRRLQLLHLGRSLQQLSPPGGRVPAYRCPESWFCEQGVWQPNDLTPLLWTQQNLLQALHLLQETTAAVL